MTDKDIRSTGIENRYEDIVTIHDEDFKKETPFMFPDEGKEPENPYSVEDLIEKIQTEFKDDILYQRVRAFKLLGKILDPEFVGNLNPYRAYSIQEACDLLGGTKKTTVYSWVRELEGVHAIDIIEKSDAKPLSWKGIIQLKMFYTLKQNGGQGNREIINHIQSKNASDVKSSADEGDTKERLNKLSEDVKRLQFLTAHVMKTIVGVEIEPSKLLDSPDKVLNATEAHIEGQRLKEKEISALVDIVQTQHREISTNKGEVTELIETIDRMKSEFDTAQKETDERYIKQMEDLKKHFDTQLETITKNQKKSLFEKLFGK